MNLFLKQIVFYLSLLILMQACSSSSFTKRRYLSGRYLDKIENPEKPNTFKTEEFTLQEYPLSAGDFYFKSNSLPKKENQLIPNAEEPTQINIKNKNIIIATDSTQVEKKTFKNKVRNIINYKPKKVYITAMPYLAFAILNLAVSLGVFISGAVIFSSAFFGGLELLSILLIPGIILLCVIFYYLILLFTKGFENFNSFNVFNKIIYVISSILIFPSGFFITIGLAAAIIGASVLLIKGILFLVALL